MNQKYFFSIIFLFLPLTGCGHYGPLYFPEDARYHVHNPPQSKAPSTAATAKQTEEYTDIDQLTIPEIVNTEEQVNGGT